MKTSSVVSLRANTYPSVVENVKFYRDGSLVYQDDDWPYASNGRNNWGSQLGTHFFEWSDDPGLPRTEFGDIVVNISAVSQDLGLDGDGLSCSFVLVAQHWKDCVIDPPSSFACANDCGSNSVGVQGCFRELCR